MYVKLKARNINKSNDNKVMQIGTVEWCIAIQMLHHKFYNNIIVWITTGNNNDLPLIINRPGFLNIKTNTKVYIYSEFIF